jgi:ElaB/YqjD/DUF883 family membrane-anchored ribosome-binding protein
MGGKKEAQMAPGNAYEIESNGKSAVQSVVGETEQSDRVVESIGQALDSTAQVVQETLRRTGSGARVAMKNVSEGIQKSTEYLAGKGMAGVVEDLEVLIRRYPFQALVIGFSLGCVLSRSRKR